MGKTFRFGTYSTHESTRSDIGRVQVYTGGQLMTERGFRSDGEAIKWLENQGYHKSELKKLGIKIKKG